MDVKDLRIGNIVDTGNGDIEIVTGISAGMIETKESLTMSKYVDGLKINADIISKNNLKYLEVHGSRFSGIIKVIYTPSIRKYHLMLGYVHLTTLEYVHELQNAFYSLTGEDLEIHI